MSDLPTFLTGDSANILNYEIELNETLRQWFSSAGFVMPTLTTAQVTQLLGSSTPPIAGTFWYNSTLNKMQFVGAGNTTQVVTSV
jgi:hypothetical protein